METIRLGTADFRRAYAAIRHALNVNPDGIVAVINDTDRITELIFTLLEIQRITMTTAAHYAGGDPHQVLDEWMLHAARAETGETK